jgi:NSS family neurotransmitter:Na+ symporter
MDLLDLLSSKYMLPLGGLFTGLFILTHWGIPNFISELNIGMDSKTVSPWVVFIFFMISVTVIGSIIINEIVEIIFGFPIIG